MDVSATAWMGCVVRKCAAALKIHKRRQHAAQELGVEVVVRGAGRGWRRFSGFSGWERGHGVLSGFRAWALGGSGSE